MQIKDAGYINCAIRKTEIKKIVLAISVLICFGDFADIKNGKPYKDKMRYIIMEEEWKLAFDNYEVSNFGNVRKKDKSIKGSLLNRGKGYKYFQVQRNGKRINILFHYLVAKLFIGERPDGMVIDHIDRNTLNNHVSNLRYVTQLENSHNTSTYRSDILTNDKRERKNIISRESARRTGRFKNLINAKGLGSVAQRENGKLKFTIKINKIRYNKTFDTIEEVEEYRSNLLNQLQQ